MKFSKAKYESNINKNINPQIFSTCGFDYLNIKSFNDLKNIQNIAKNYNEELSLNTKDIEGINFIVFEYFSNYNIDTGGNIKYFMGKIN